MKNLKTTIIAATFVLCCFTQTNAQSTPIKGISVKGGHNPKPTFLFSVGGGLSSPSSEAKDKAFLSNTTAINADVFLPLVRKGIQEGGLKRFSAGLNIGGSYNFGGSGGFGTYLPPWTVTGQTSSMVVDRGVDPKSPGFRMGAGPQVNFYFGKLIVSPMVLGEYFSMTQKEMSIVQTTQYNGQSYDFTLATSPETKTSGFAITPKLRLQYMISDRFGFFADASYTTGPKIETTVSKLIPNGNPLIDLQSYNLQQLQTGTMVKGETKSTAYSAMGINFGVVIGLGKNGNKGWNGVAETIQSTDANKVSAPLPGDGHVILTPECCVDPVTGRNTGLIRFKMTGTLVYASIKVTSGTGIYLTETMMPFVNNTYSDCFRNPVKFEYVPNYSTPGMTTTSTMNGVVTNTFTYNRRFACLTRFSDIKLTIDKAILVPEGPFSPFNPDIAVTWSLDDFKELRLNSSGTTKDGEKIDMSCPVEIDEETGKIFLTGTPEITKTVNGKTSKIKSDYIQSKKHNYVGHITLLR
jgi:hypothetical protein